MIYLVSNSPRRKEMLAQIGISFHAYGASIDETPLECEPPKKYVERIAQEKARYCLNKINPDCPILAADTAVIIDDQILGKPKSQDDARQMLTKLSGRVHQVLTAVVVLYQQDMQTVCINTEVEFREIEKDELELYLNTDEPYDKAGSYAIQGKAALFIKRINGSYTSVVGLPLMETYLLLKQMGITMNLKAQ